jgi:hypothetical protein
MNNIVFRIRHGIKQFESLVPEFAIANLVLSEVANCLSRRRRQG